MNLRSKSSIVSCLKYHRKNSKHSNGWKKLSHRTGKVYFYVFDFSGPQFYLRVRSGTKKKKKKQARKTKV